MAAKYQDKGFSKIYLACVCINIQCLIDLLETMFWDMTLEDIDITELESEATKELHQEAAKAEGASVAIEHGPIPTDTIMWVFITSILIPIEFRIPPKSIPETENIKEKFTKNPAKKITHFYYTCHMWPFSSKQAINDDAYKKVLIY